MSVQMRPTETSASRDDDSENTIIGLCSMCCSGKSTVVSIMNDMGVQSTSMGNVVRSVADELDVPPWKAAQQLRSKNDTEIARRTRGAIATALEEDGFVVVDGLRSVEEMQYYETQFPEASFVLTEVWCDHNTRVRRYMEREDTDFAEALSALAVRDGRELDVGLGTLLERTHTTVWNDCDTTMDDLRNRVEQLVEHVAVGGGH